MPLECKLTAAQIVSSVGMSDDPGFYSGRGATPSDLDERRLELIYQKVEGSHGKPAADQFVQMVAAIPVLSATDFLLTFYRLGQNGWRWEKELLGNENGHSITSRASAFAEFANVLASRRPLDQTDLIRNQFLRNHGVEVDEGNDANTENWLRMYAGGEYGGRQKPKQKPQPGLTESDYRKLRTEDIYPVSGVSVLLGSMGLDVKLRGEAAKGCEMYRTISLQATGTEEAYCAASKMFMEAQMDSKLIITPKMFIDDTAYPVKVSLDTLNSGADVRRYTLIVDRTTIKLTLRTTS